VARPGLGDVVFRLEDWNHGRSLISNLRWSEPWLYWVEMRFEEAGRSVLVRVRVDKGRTSPPEEVLPSDVTVSSQVYEYGGGAFAVSGDRVVFVDGRDQSMRVRDGDAPVSLLLAADSEHRYGDLDAVLDLLVAVRERRGGVTNGGEPVHDIVLVSADGTVRSVASGRDFYAAPRLSPDGRWLSFLAWDHPWMPWDAAELYVLEMATMHVRHVAGGRGAEPPTSVVQPQWTRTGDLVYLHDDTGHWEPRVARHPGKGTEIARCHRLGRDLAGAPWALGVRSSDAWGTGMCAASPGPRPVLLRWDGAPDSAAVRLTHGFESVTEVVRVDGDTLALLASVTGRPEGVYVFRTGFSGARPIATTRRDPPPPGAASPPVPIRFPARDGGSVHALWFSPVGRRPGTRGAPPPVIVNAHGGPTYAAWVPLDYRVQFWTARGYGVLDVDYRGSSGYGRAYRDALYGNWGRRDVQDCVDGARWLVEQGQADPGRLVIRGESAGGYTALCAASYEQTFAVAIAHYGVSEPVLQGATTHKFEHHYVGRLLGGEPPRSPLARVADISAALLLTHGSEDRVVPPEQTRLLAVAARRSGVRVRHLELTGEGHGYRRAESVVQVRRAEEAALEEWLL
jgi:dipeptidyl aminopeptidase/acylaminoacyl peptidase